MTATKVDNLSWSEKKIVEYFKYTLKRLDLHDDNVDINECDHCSADLPSRDYDRFCNEECEIEYERNRYDEDDWFIDDEDDFEEEYDDEAEYEP